MAKCSLLVPSSSFLLLCKLPEFDQRVYNVLILESENISEVAITVYLLSSPSLSPSLIWHNIECYDGGRESGRGGRGRQRVRWINANWALILQAHQGRRQGQINAEQHRPAHAGSRSHAKTHIAASVPNIPSLSPPPIHQTLHSIHQHQLSAQRSHSGRFICAFNHCSEMAKSWAAEFVFQSQFAYCSCYIVWHIRIITSSAILHWTVY